MELPRRAKDLTKVEFEHLVVKKPVGRTKDRNIVWLCECECGRKVRIDGHSLRRGVTVSCGCVGKARRRAANTTHGMTGTRLHRVWMAMVARCHNESSSAFKYYGARGIAVCDRWRESFENFLADMGEPPDGYELDRYPDNNGPYSPENCRWATRPEQIRNTRRNHLVTFGGETLTVTDWAARMGVTHNAMAWRLKKWGTERALSLAGPRTKATSGSR